MAALVDETFLRFFANTVEPRMSDPLPPPSYDQQSATEKALRLVAGNDWHDDDDDDLDDDDDDDFFPDDDEDSEDDTDDVDDDF